MSKRKPKVLELGEDVCECGAPWLEKQYEPGGSVFYECSAGCWACGECGEFMPQNEVCADCMKNVEREAAKAKKSSEYGLH